MREKIKQKNRISVVIPVFNEEKTIGKVIENVKKVRLVNEIIVICSKKSTDRTWEKASSYGVIMLEDKGKGKGLAMRLSVKKVKNEIIVFIDADGSHIPVDIPKLVEPIIKKEVDMVIGSRFLGGSEELHGDFNKFLRMFFSMVIALIINLRFKSKIQDTQNGFRAIRKNVFKKLNLKSIHTEIETEMCMKCLKKGYKIKEIPSKELKRMWGKSNISLFKHGWRYAWIVLKNVF